MRISCTKSHVELESDSGHPTPGVAVTCSRCGNEQESYGTHRRSVKRCLVLLNETCPEDENNFYEVNR
ncbi:hypothetical protein [Haladaptatus sp. NG-SE-30]